MAIVPDELLVEHLRLGLSHDPTVLQEFHRMIKLVWFQRKEPQPCQDGVIESSGQEKGRDRVLELSGHFTRTTRG